MRYRKLAVYVRAKAGLKPSRGAISTGHATRSDAGNQQKLGAIDGTTGATSQIF